MANKFRFGAPCGNEYGKYVGGKAGDQKQTGTDDYKGECRFTDYDAWYTYVARPKKKYAEKIATAMEQLVNNKHIGYSQGKTRTSLYPLAREKGWNIAKVSKNCECDCSSGTSVCINASGISVPSDMSTATTYNALKQTGCFTITKANGKVTELKRGDIVWKPNYHIAVVCTESDEPKVGAKCVLLANVRLRTGAGKKFKVRQADNLAPACKKLCMAKTGDAILKVGSIITPIEVDGTWLKIKSGWLCWRNADGKTLIRRK